MRLIYKSPVGYCNSTFELHRSVQHNRTSSYQHEVLHGFRSDDDLRRLLCGPRRDQLLLWEAAVQGSGSPMLGSGRKAGCRLVDAPSEREGLRRIPGQTWPRRRVLRESLLHLRVDDLLLMFSTMNDVL